MDNNSSLKSANLVEIHSLHDYYRILKDKEVLTRVPNNRKDIKCVIDNIYFRGQSAKYSTIISGLPRANGFINNEHSMFKETLLERQQEFANMTMPMAQLAKMQHYGLPTRLVDFTVNPLIALFFAVQDHTDDSDAIVFIYKNYYNDDLATKIISVLPTIPVKSIQSIHTAVIANYQLDLTNDIILNNINKTPFVPYLEDVDNTNQRIINQQGTFAICGNIIRNNEISDEVCCVNTLDAHIILFIPKIYKDPIKRDLDISFSINESYIYPELPSWTEYMRIKHKEDSFYVWNSYDIVAENDMPLADSAVKRLKIAIVLKKPLTIDQARKVARNAVEKYKTKYSIIWFDIADDNTSYSTSKWIVSGQWVANNTKQISSYIPLSIVDNEGYYWVDNYNHGLLKMHSEENLFWNEKELFLAYHYVFKQLYEYYQAYCSSHTLQEFDDFIEDVERREFEVKAMCDRVAEFGFAREVGLQSYLENYIDFFVNLDDISRICKIPQPEKNWVHWRIGERFDNLNRAVNRINQGKKQWMDFLNLKDDDLKDNRYELDMKSLVKFKQSLPISDQLLNVVFDIGHEICGNKLILNGKTNLYDDAKISLFLYQGDGVAIIRAVDSIVKNGEFLYELQHDILTWNHYSVHLLLNAPRKQKASFVDKAGKEYENLGGEYIDRCGVDSTILYRTKINLKDL